MSTTSVRTVRIATERLYRTVDGRVVLEGDPDAAFLLAAPGHPVPDDAEIPASDDADMTDGASDGAPDAPPADDSAAKAAEQPVNKAGKQPANKAAKA